MKREKINKMKRLIALLIMTTCLFQSVFGLTFNDLDDAKWAENYILALAEKGIVNGYQDGSYRPLDSVSYYAAVLVLYRTLDAQGLIDEADANIYVNRYRSTLIEYDVPNWPDLDKAITYSIEKGIIEPSDISDFVVDGKHNAIPREKMALYMGRAWNLFLREALENPPELPFKDVAKIEQTALNYVAMLYQHNIINGDNEGYFKPQSALSRAALAKLLITGIVELTATKNIINREIEAYVYVKLDATKKIVFYQTNSQTESRIEKIDDSVEIIIDGKKSNYDDLILNQEVVLSYANDKLVSIRVGKIFDEIAGKTVSGQLTDKLTYNNKQFIYLNDEASGNVLFFELASDVVIISGEQKINFGSLAVGDVVTLTVDSDIVKLIRK